MERSCVLLNFCFDFGFCLLCLTVNSKRADAVVVVVVVVIVDVARRRNAKKNTTHGLYAYCLSFVLQAMDIYFTSVTIFDQYAAELSFSRSSAIDSSM